MRCNACQTRGDGSQSSVGRKRRPHRTTPARLGWAQKNGMTAWESITTRAVAPLLRLSSAVSHLTQSTHHSLLTAQVANCLTRSLGSFAPLSSSATINGFIPSIDRRRGSRSTSLCPCTLIQAKSECRRRSGSSHGPSYLDHSSKQTNHLASWGLATSLTACMTYTTQADPVSSSAHHANTCRGSTPSASSEGFWAQEANPPTIWGRFCHRVAESRGVCGDLGRIWLLLQGLADDWQAGQSPRG